MRMAEIVRIDAKGRAVFPMSVREALGLREGMYVMVIADLDRKEVSIIPFADPEARLMEFRVGFGDAPGALARVAKVLADANVDLLATESRTLHRGEAAEWSAIADVSKCKLDIKELKAKILKDGAAKSVEAREYPRTR